VLWSGFYKIQRKRGEKFPQNQQTSDQNSLIYILTVLLNVFSQNRKAAAQRETSKEVTKIFDFITYYFSKKLKIKKKTCVFANKIALKAATAIEIKKTV